MQLQHKMKPTKDGIFVSAYGNTDNTYFDNAAISLLYYTGRFIHNSDILSRIDEIEGTVQGSDYTKRILGPVHVKGCPTEPETCKVQYVNIRKGGVSEHPHPEGEWYLIPEDSGDGILTLGGSENHLCTGSFYNIPFDVGHALAPIKDDMSVLVFKFSQSLVKEYTKQSSLRLILEGLEKSQ